MGWGGRIPLPSRSPDLIPIDFQQWRHIKEFTLLCLPDIIDRIHEQPNFCHRLQKCIYENGDVFNH